MTPGIRPLVAGNWKMNGTIAALDQVRAIGSGFQGGVGDFVDGLICPPATLVSRVADLLRETPVRTGGQDCHPKEHGAHTGDISATMLKEAGASHVIVGHSERRTDHHETDELVMAKAEGAHAAGLVAIICIGETLKQREDELTLEILSVQLRGSVPRTAVAQNTIIAYEPVWAIGTGLTPTVDNVAEAHAHIRAELFEMLGEPANSVRILYGGSVKPSNAAELMHIDNVDGALVGGASLKADDFLGIADAYRRD